MKRKFFNLACATSLLLCAATVVLWVRSYLVMDVAGRSFTSFGGWIECESRHYTVFCDRQHVFPIPGLQIRFGRNPELALATRQWQVRVRYYWIVALLLVPPLRWALQFYHQKRPGIACCVQCHYNLTGNTSGICPECGIAIAPDTSTSSRGNK